MSVERSESEVARANRQLAQYNRSQKAIKAISAWFEEQSEPIEPDRLHVVWEFPKGELSMDDVASLAAKWLFVHRHEDSPYEQVVGVRTSVDVIIPADA